MNANYGFIHEKLEIKILILYIMRRLPGSIPLDILTELTMCDDGISYFDFAESLAELVSTEHLRIDDNKYSLTGKGIRNGEITENSLPFSVRMKVESATSAIRTALNRDKMIKSFYIANPNGGYTVSLSMSDGVGKVVSIDLLAANKRQASALAKSFRSNAERIYHALIKLILE